MSLQNQASCAILIYQAECLCFRQSVSVTLAVVGVLLVIADGSLSAWLTLLARLCDFAIALLNFFKEVDGMKKVLALVGKGVNGVPCADPRS